LIQEKRTVSATEVMKGIIQQRLFAHSGDTAVIQKLLVNRLNFNKFQRGAGDTIGRKQEGLQADLLAERIQ